MDPSPVLDSPADSDLQTIKDVLSVHHVPVVASLQWEKLNTMLHTLCDRIALQAIRLDKAEEQGKSFLGFKDELDQMCRNCVREMKEERESEAEQRKKWAGTIEEKLQSLQQGIDANSNDMKQLGNSVAELQSLDTKVQSFSPRLDALEEATKNFERVDALEEMAKGTDNIIAAQAVSLETLNQKLEVLLADFDEQNDKLHTIEEQNEQLKLKLEQTTTAHAAELDALQQYCKNLRSDFELKFLVEAESAKDELSSASKAKLEAAVAELQNRMQKKADLDEIEKLLQINQNLRDNCAKMESNMVELQSQLKRMDAGSRRASRASFIGGLMPRPSQIQLSLPDLKPTSLDDLSPKLVEELTKDIKDAIENHNKELEKVQKEFGLLGRSILKMSGHHDDQLNSGTIDRLVKIFEGLVGNAPRQIPLEASLNGQARLSIATVQNPVGIMQDTKDLSGGQAPKAPDLKKDVFVETVDQMDDNAVVQAIDDALKTNKFEPKENVRTLSKLCDELLKLISKIQELDTAVPALKDALVLKADKRDLQKLARFVKEQLERPENAIFTGKPLYGFKCMSCDHNIEKLSRITGERVTSNRMPPQVLPMLSAERIFSMDRRQSNNLYGQGAAQGNNKPWMGIGVENGNVDKRQQRFRKGSPKNM